MTFQTPMLLQRHNSVVNFYRFCLTTPSIFTRLSTNKAAVLAVAAVVASGCAGMESRPAAEVVKERSMARWNALIKADLKTAYDFYTPATRKTLKYEGFVLAYQQGYFKGATVDKVVCPKPDVCDVDLTLETNFKGRQLKGPVRETWIREGNDWWYAYKG